MDYAAELNAESEIESGGSIEAPDPSAIQAVSTRTAEAECQRCNEQEVTGHLNEATAAVLSAAAVGGSPVTAASPTTPVSPVSVSPGPVAASAPAAGGTVVATAASTYEKPPQDAPVAVITVVEQEPLDTPGSVAIGGGNGDGEYTDNGAAYTVTGIVSSPVLPAIGGLTVQLLDYNAGAEPTTLSTTATANDGSYAFNQVVISSSYLQQYHKTSPDLQVQVSATADGAVLAASAVAYSAPTTLSLNVILPSTASGLPSEYELLTAQLVAAYPGSLAGLKEDATQQDITYLANKTGWDARAVALAAIATQFSHMTAPTTAPVTAPTPSPTPLVAPAASTGDGQQNEATASTLSVAPEFFYALSRAGLPTDPDGLFRANSAQVQAIWQQAIADGVIPKSAESHIPTAVTNFTALAASHLLTAAPTIGVSTLQQMLTPILPDSADQLRFARLYNQHQGDVTALWPAVQQAFPAVADKLQLAGQLNYLTVNNTPLVSALTAKTPLTSPLDLVAAGYYGTNKWLSLIGTTPIPQQIKGSTPSAQASNYAKYLAAQVRLSYPTAVLADQVKNNIIPIADTTDVATGVADFLNTHQADFQIGAEPIGAYITRTGLTGVQPQVINQIKRLQRAYQLTPDDTSMAVLLHHGLDSAYALTRYDTAAFVRAFADKLGGQATATAIHHRAKQVFSATLNIAVSYLKARTEQNLGGPNSPVLTGFPAPTGVLAPPTRRDAAPRQDNPVDSPADNATPAPPATAVDPVPASATLEALFGSMDYCSCSDCSSILSPTAYLVDLLHYLDQPAPASGDNPQEVLLTRRPDLQYLPLTCANTNTAMPYIDLVNETLEYLVSHNDDISGYQGHDTPEGVTSAELIASPQYVDDSAYALLQQAFFPPPLPFNRPLTLLRAHLHNLRISLPAAMTTLLAAPPGTSSYGPTDILIEQLGISRDEYKLFTDFDLSTGKALPNNLQLGDLYGLPDDPTPPPQPPPNIALHTLQAMNLQDFTRHIDISYADLVAILQTQFINPNAVLIPKLQRLNAPFKDLQTLHDNPGSIAAQFMSDLPAGLDATEYGAPTPDISLLQNKQAVINWVTSDAVYPRIMDLIVINNPTGDLGDCSGTNLRLQYSNPDPTVNQLSRTDYLKIIRFIRLWQKLAPLLSAGDDAISIDQTDDIITALYPPNELATSSNDDTNQAHLDTGFQTLIQNAGTVFQALNLLSLTPDQGLAQLLTCWAPIQTYGPNALYQRMFLTPTLLAQDPGPQTATVSTTVGAGDKLDTYINNTLAVEYIVTTLDTSDPTSTATKVAQNIAVEINNSAAVDPAWGDVPLNSRFFASSSNDVITITAGVTLACTVSSGAGITYGPATGYPLSWSALISGTPKAGDTVTSTIDGVDITYTVQPADTTAAALAANIAAAINNATIPDPLSGLPVNRLVYANPNGATIYFVVMGSGAPFTLTCTDTPAAAGSSTTVPSYTAPTPTPAHYRVELTGSITQGDIFTTTINTTADPVNDVTFTYTAGPNDTPAMVVAAIANEINTSVLHDPATGLLLSSEVHATTSDEAGIVFTLDITPTDPSTPITLTPSVETSGSAAYSPWPGTFPEQVVATVAGTIPPGAVLTTTINGIPLLYQVAAGDTNISIATNIAAKINKPPLNSVVFALAASGLTAGSARIDVLGLTPTTPFTFTASLDAGGYLAGQARPAFADDGYGNYLPVPSTILPGELYPTLFAHEATLCAACNLTGAEFTLIAEDLNFDATTALSLDNVSALFRRGWLAHTLGISVLEFLQLRKFSGLDPTPDPTTGQQPALIPFIQLVLALNNAGLIPAQALYLMWNQDNAGTFTPPQSIVTGLAAALVADFAAVDTEFARPPGGDPDGSIAKKLMTLVYGADTTNTFFGLLNSTFATSIPYSVPPGQTTLPEPVLTAGAGAGGQLSYDNIAKQLTFSGVLTVAGNLNPTPTGPLTPTADTIAAAIVDTTDSTHVNAGPTATFTPASMANIGQNTILVIDTGPMQESVTVLTTTATTFTASTSNPHDGTATPFRITNDPNLKAAVTKLQSANQKAITQFFAAYPELAPLYSQYVASSAPVQDRHTVLLTGFLPILIAARKREQALATATSTAGVDPSFAAALLQDPTILHADTDPTVPALDDLTNVENQGLTAQFYLNNDPSGTPDQTIDPQPSGPTPSLSYAQTATITATPTAGTVLTTTIAGVAIPYQVQTTDTDATVLAASIAADINTSTQPVPSAGGLPMNQVVTASAQGPVVVIAGRDPSGANGVYTLDTQPKPTYTPGTQLPTGATPAGIAAVWRGYLTVAQNGNYDINIATDAGAQIRLDINGADIPGELMNTLWSNLGPITLTAGNPIPITVTATGIKTTFSASWTTKGMGWQPIPIANLYSYNLVNQLANTYTRFLKAASLASALTLTAPEIAYLGTAPNHVVNTTSKSPVAPGTPATFVPASITNISGGSPLIIDSGVNAELVHVISVDPTATPPAFTATVTKAHDGSTTPFAIISQAQPSTGQGWLNFLTAQGNPDTPTSAAMTAVLSSLLDFARIKRALSPSDERLLAVLIDPTAGLPGTQTPPQYGLESLTGWSRSSLNALLTHFFPGSGLFPAATTAATLSSLDNFGRIYDAFALVTSTGLSAAIMLSAIANTPTPATVGALQSALRARYAESDWLTVIQPINDTVRTQQRDALVAYILQQRRAAYLNTLKFATTTAQALTGATALTVDDTSQLSVGMIASASGYLAPGTTITNISGTTITLSSPVLAQTPASPPGITITFAPPDQIPIVDADGLYDLLLVDTQTQPAVLTSRIRLALSIVQLFIERIIRDLEPKCDPNDIDNTQWSWMKTYRVWQANREVFLWPENWAYPQLRDDQSPFFEQMITSLGQGDITDDAAATAYLSYLTSLEEVAKLEPCGMYYVPGSPDTDETTYVVARTAGATRKYYFRELSGGSWTPWTPVKIDCEDLPLIPVVWNGRLFLFWLKMFKQSPRPNAPTFDPNAGDPNDKTTLATLQTNTLQNGLTTADSAGGNATVEAALCWAEYYNGAWQPSKTSDINLRTQLGMWNYDQQPVTFEPTTYPTSGPYSFEAKRSLLHLIPFTFSSDLPNTLTIAIADYSVYHGGGQGWIVGGFVLHNTHSTPIPLDKLIPPNLNAPVQANPPIPLPSFADYINFFWGPGWQIRDFWPDPFLYTGANSGGTFAITDSPWDFGGGTITKILDFTWAPRFIDTVNASGNYGAHPFIYEDRLAQFYVTTTQGSTVIFDGWPGGWPAAKMTASNGSGSAPLMMLKRLPSSGPNGSPANPSGLGISPGSNISVALPLRTLVTYQGRLITPSASTAALSRALPNTVDAEGSH
jgi:hypothetical protein